MQSILWKKSVDPYLVNDRLSYDLCYKDQLTKQLFTKNFPYFFMKYNIFPPDFCPNSNIDTLYCTQYIVKCTAQILEKMPLVLDAAKTPRNPSRLHDLDDVVDTQICLSPVSLK
jgi:hypothetical protein